MKLVRTCRLSVQQTDRINTLWDAEYPVGLTGRFLLLLDGVASFRHHLLVDEDNEIRGGAVEFEKDAEIRFSIIVPSSQQGSGYGALLLDSLKSGLDEFYGWSSIITATSVRTDALIEVRLPSTASRGFRGIGKPA